MGNSSSKGERQSVKPKPLFWVAVFLIVLSLLGFALYRTGMFSLGTWEKEISRVIPGRDSTPSSQKYMDIAFYSSSAKNTWINEMVKQFNDAGYQAGDQTLRVNVWHVTSGGSLDDLKVGKIKPDIWSPGDESWLQMASAYWRDVKQRTLYDNYTPLVNIPLIVAMWEPMARVLGYPAPISWKDIAKVAANPNGWAAYGHPEWGKFRWGHAHPDANSGFLTILSEVYAALDKTEGITSDDLKRPAVVSFLKSFEGAVEHYGLSNSWIDELMQAKGPSYLSATVQYENTIIQTNEKTGNKPFKLVALYPTEGNFWTQHPAAILKEDWVTAEKEDACKKFIQFLISKEAQLRAMKMGLRPILKDIDMEAPFDELHGVNAQISTEKMFKVPDEGVLKRIRDLWEDVKVPATIILVLDRSGSMKGAPMDNAKQGAIQFIQNMKPRDQLIVILFNNTITALSDLCLIQQCGEEILVRLSTIFAEGNTSLHDAVHYSYNLLSKLKKDVPNRRYAVLLLSDGKDTSSQLNRHDFLDSLPRGEDFDAPKIYSIAYGSEADKELLSEISNRTNARVFVSTPDEIKKTYKELSANF